MEEDTLKYHLDKARAECQKLKILGGSFGIKGYYVSFEFRKEKRKKACKTCGHELD